METPARDDRIRIPVYDSSLPAARRRSAPLRYTADTPHCPKSMTMTSIGSSGRLKARHVRRPYRRCVRSVFPKTCRVVDVTDNPVSVTLETTCVVNSWVE